MPDQQRPDAVVVGCGRSAAAQAAIVTATVEAARRRLPLILLVVDEPRTNRANRLAPGVKRLAADVMGVAARQGAMVAEATDPAVPVEIVAINHEDDRETAILAERTALFVVPARGLDGHQVLLLGCTTDEVIRRARCPVMIPHVSRPSAGGWPDEGRGDSTVRVLLTGRPDDVGVVRSAAHEAQWRGVALWAVRPVPEGAGGPAVVDGLMSAWRALSAVAECASLGCRVELVANHRADALLARCRPDDLLVVGAHDAVRRPGSSALVELIRGSALRGTLNSLPCDVLLVPPAGLDWTSGPSLGPRAVQERSTAGR